MSKIFLTADWRRLLMLSYTIEPQVLAKHVPRGTELDVWQGHTFVSLVAFRFLNTKVKGLPVPFHRHFDEINLRFYVRYRGPDGWRRGVVFVREVVPRWAIAAVARWLYNENYVACPTRSTWIEPNQESEGHDSRGRVEYGWRHAGSWLNLSARFDGQPSEIETGSQEEFITEHFWGYSSQRDGGTVEYQVEHPKWRVWPASDARVEGDVISFYGEEFASALAGPPSSAFIADGSPVIVRGGQRIDLV